LTILNTRTSCRIALIQLGHAESIKQHLRQKTQDGFVNHVGVLKNRKMSGHHVETRNTNNVPKENMNKLYQKPLRSTDILDVPPHFSVLFPLQAEEHSVSKTR
jgi:hypothetical protein